MRQGLNRQTVIEAAAEIAEEEGFEKITLASVAKKLHIKTPSLYNHIDNLMDLKKALACYGIQKFAAALAEPAIGKSGDDALYAIGTAYVDFVRCHQGLYEAITRVPDPTDSEFEQESDKILKLLGKVMEGYHLDHEEAIHAVRGLRSIAHGFSSLELNHGFNMNASKQKSLRWMLEAYMTGMKAMKKSNVLK